MSKFEKTYKVEEFHRGEWIPLMITNKEGKRTGKHKTVRITPQEAEINNRYSNQTKFRYLIEEDVVEKTDNALDEARAAYQEKFDKKPHYTWDVEKINEKINE